MNFKELSLEEFDSVTGLLQEANLQYSDLKQPHVRLFRFDENGKTIGVGGLEIFGNLALLRSVAVSQELQGTGLGSEVVSQIEHISKVSGISSLYLLTTTASRFFKSRGYQLIHRDEFPEELKQTAQFSGLCPVSAICMKKVL